MAHTQLVVFNYSDTTAAGARKPCYAGLGENKTDPAIVFTCLSVCLRLIDRNDICLVYFIIAFVLIPLLL